VSPFFQRLATGPTMVSTVAEILDAPTIRLFSSTAWMKPAHIGPPKPPHQDAAHWLHVSPCEFVTCWVAFDASTAVNGCVYFQPGSHQGPILPHIRIGELLIDNFCTDTGVPAQLNPGDASLHLGRTVHWSGPNTSTHPRRGVAFTFCRGDASSTNADLGAMDLMQT
jgi:ectoine hydroxylase-related dioxygenase (phytanoyl-CoA dioxygenase family)